jgi:hypothetical protein
MLLLSLFIGLVCIAHLFAGVYIAHRQTCRKRLRELRTAVIAAVHRQDLQEDFKVMGGSGGRR